MRTWRDRVVSATAVAVVLLAGSGLAAGLHNALFEADDVKAGSFRPNVEVQAESPVTSITSTTAAVEDTTTTTASTVPTTTSTVRARTATTVQLTTSTSTTSTTAATTTSTTQDNRGRGRGRPPDD